MKKNDSNNNETSMISLVSHLRKKELIYKARNTVRSVERNHNLWMGPSLNGEEVMSDMRSLILFINMLMEEIEGDLE